jgi:Amt family ammonium transporter
VFLDRDMRILELNPAFAAILARPAEELVGRSLHDHTHTEDRIRSRRQYQAALDRASPVSLQERYLRSDGAIRTVSVHAHPQQREAYIGKYLFCQVRDVSEERAAQEALAHQAVHDPLTGLFNRTLFLDRLGRALSAPRSGTLRVAALVIDLDQFKLINDSFGHSQGDHVLLTLAGRLQRVVRPLDTLARLGGDEFVLLVEQPSEPADVIAVAERLRAAINEPVSTPNGVFVLSASIGIALADSSTTAEDLLSDADAAMYAAKAKGRGRIVVFDDTMRLAVTQRLALETELRQAIINDEFVLHYQPIIDTCTGLPSCMEALVRWQHPTRGLLPPAEFIPLAEENGSIVEIGRWVLGRASSDLARWQRDPAVAGPMRVCVNVSARQLHDDRFIGDVVDALTAHRIEPGTLTIEVTESALLDESMAPSTTLQQIRDLGIPILLDDFGTGYSSLGYIQRFPIDGIKLDRSFVAELGADDTSAAIVEAILMMSGALRLYVVAEGVETASQIETLVSLGCRYLQGFAYARPMPSNAVLEYLTATEAPVG